MTVMILPLPPAPRTDNVFFLATPEKLAQEESKPWVEGFNKHWTAFVTQRQKELKPHGQLFVNSLVYGDVPADFQIKESKFFATIAQELLTEVLTEHDLLDKLPSCLKTSVSMKPSHYTDVVNKLGSLQISSMNTYDVVDCFWQEYEKTKDSKVFGQKVAAYINGWWGHVLEGGLEYEGVDAETVKKVSNEVFQKRLPEFVSQKTDIYPEFY